MSDLSYHIDQVDNMETEFGLVGADYSGREVIQAAKAYNEIISGKNKPRMIPINTHIRRYEDMSPTGCLILENKGRFELFREEDGDMCVTVIDKEGNPSTVQFCTYNGGGGQSPKVLKALYDLAAAMLEENENAPQHRE